MRRERDEGVLKGQRAHSQPDGRSLVSASADRSLRHWHEAEDEFLYVLDGTVTLLENDDRWGEVAEKSKAYISGTFSPQAMENVFRLDIDPHPAIPTFAG